MTEDVRVTLTLALPDSLLERIQAADDRLHVTTLSRAQRRAYRGGRQVWAGYGEPSGPDDESDEQARANLDSVLRQTEVLFTTPIVPEDILQRAPQPRWVQLTSAGVDRLLDTPLFRSGVTVTSASGIHAVPIGEYVLGAMLAFAKGLPRAMRAQAEHTWRPYWAEELLGKTVGIIGAGAIGGYVAKLARVLGMRVIAARRSPGQRVEGRVSVDEYIDVMLPASELGRLLAESDYVVVAVPLTPETRGMIGEAELRQMKPSAVIINIARGPIIDEPALVRALREGWIAGAALDVFQQEPLPADSPLWDMDNVLVTPHISGGQARYMEVDGDLFCHNLRRYLAGQPLRNVVEAGRGY